MLPCRQLGYNTVRLPFRYLDLDYPYPKDYSVSCWSMSQGEGYIEQCQQTNIL